MILFSVIIPTYNRAGFIKTAIDSVLSQTYSNWELIVIDDASTDHTPEILAQYKEDKIRVHRNETNLERSASRNIGIELAKGDYICFLDSDDYFLPGHLNVLAAFIEKHSASKALFHTGVKQINIKQQTERLIERSALQNQVEAVMDFHIPIISVAIHKEILSHLRFDPQLKINEDAHLFARIASFYPVIYNPEVSVVWVLHGSNTINNEIDYITPQLKASQLIFNEPGVSLKVSSAYKQKKYFNLYSQLVYFHASHQRHGWSSLYFIKGVLAQPFDKNNRTNLMNVIYHLPGGQWLKKAIQFFNR